MDKNYGEFLSRQLKEAQEAFEEAKKAAIRDIEAMQYYHANDYGAAYFTHIDKITAAGAKVEQIILSMRAYDHFHGEEEN